MQQLPTPSAGMPNGLQRCGRDANKTRHRMVRAGHFIRAVPVPAVGSDGPNTQAPQILKVALGVARPPAGRIQYLERRRLSIPSIIAEVFPMTAVHERLARCAWVCSFMIPMWVHGQADPGTLLKGAGVTESNVLEALVPRSVSPDLLDDEPSRGIRPSIRASAAADSLKPHKKPTASLLITFHTDSTVLTQRSKEQLDIVATALMNDRLKDFKFTIEGHADRRGQSEANHVLSQQRAEVVRRYLIDIHGIHEGRLQAVGKGDSEPMNTRDIAAPENRRVAITTVTP
jgi:outer membrane protein OmpA-like peptidoglycan-associated protein